MQFFQLFKPGPALLTISTFSLQRLRQSLWPLAQIVLAAISSYAIAQLILGTQEPILAAILAVVSLGFSRDTRIARVLATVIAMFSGITVSTLLLITFGSGVWQLAVAVLAAGALARVFTANSTLAVTMVIQALLVQALPEPSAGYLSRAFEGLIGGTVALLFTALLPRNPVRMLQEVETLLFRETRETISIMRSVLKAPKNIDQEAGWAKSKELGEYIQAWREVYGSAKSIVNTSPFYLRYRHEVAQSQRRLEAMDLATRNLRVLARRFAYLQKSDPNREYYAEILGDFNAAIMLIEMLGRDFSTQRKAQKQIRKLAQRLAVPEIQSGASAYHISALMQFRPLWVDLAVASGYARGEAREILSPED